VKEQIYHIHDLVDIWVAPEVGDSIITQLDFQIGFFKTESKNSKSFYRISIYPFSEYKFDKTNELCAFHLLNGVHEKNMVDEYNRIAICKNGHEFHIFTDVPFLINLFIQLIFLERRITLVHAAAVADLNGNVILLPGAGGVGKTTLLSTLVGNYGYKLLGDDIVGLSEKGECFAFPRSFVLKEYHREVFSDVFKDLNIKKPKSGKKTLKTKTLKFIKDNMPLLGITKSVLKRIPFYNQMKDSFSLPQSLPYLAAVPVEKIFGKESVAERGKITKIIFLERYYGDKFVFKAISEESLTRRMFAIINHEWVEVMRQLYSMSALEIINLPDYFLQISQVISKGIAEKESNILLIPNSSSPTDLCNQFIKMAKL
jgi:hypothetical protein